MRRIIIKTWSIVKISLRLDEKSWWWNKFKIKESTTCSKLFV